MTTAITPATLDLESKTEKSLRQWFTRTDIHSITLGMPVRFEEMTEEDGQVTLPCIILHIQREAEDPMPGTGVWRLQLDAKLDIQADDTTNAAISTAWSNLITLLTWGNLAAELSNLDDYHCHAVRYPLGSDHTHIDRHFHYEFHCQLWAMCMDEGTDRLHSSSSSASTQSSLSSLSSSSSSLSSAQT